MSWVLVGKGLDSPGGIRLGDCNISRLLKKSEVHSTVLSGNHVYFVRCDQSRSPAKVKKYWVCRPRTLQPEFQPSHSIRSITYFPARDPFSAFQGNTFSPNPPSKPTSQLASFCRVPAPSTFFVDHFAMAITRRITETRKTH